MRGPFETDVQWLRGPGIPGFNTAQGIPRASKTQCPPV